MANPNKNKGKLSWGEVKSIPLDDALGMVPHSIRGGVYADIKLAIMKKINNTTGAQAFSVPGIELEGKPLTRETAAPLIQAINVELKRANSRFVARFSEISDCVVILPKDRVTLRMGRGAAVA